MKKNIKSITTIFLILSLIITLQSSYKCNARSEYFYVNECFQKYEVFGDISDINNIKDISASIGNDDELDWYYVSKGKNEIPEGPKESIDFLKENSAYYLGDTSKKVLYLTFDEGHENDNTPKILDILKEFKVPAAFFITKPFIDNHPDQVKRMVAEGHIVGNHSVHHTSMTRKNSLQSLMV
jgi:peptidoglycan-N-acetylmuramic acid deacetylase